MPETISTFTKYETITSVVHHSDQLQLLPPVTSSAPGCGCTNLLRIWGTQQNLLSWVLVSGIVAFFQIGDAGKWGSSKWCGNIKQTRDWRSLHSLKEMHFVNFRGGCWAQSMSTKFTSTADDEIDEAPSPWSRWYSTRQIDAGLSNITEEQLYPYWSYCFPRQEEIAYIKT